jgi:hypothetical protein
MYTFGMTDVVAPLPFITIDDPTPPAALFELAERARQYGINPDRPFFPVNSLRLLYFMVLDQLTNGNKEVIEKMGDLILKVEAVLAAREQGKIAATLDSEKDLTKMLPALQDLRTTFTNSNLDRVVQELVGVILPNQDQQLFFLGTQMNYLKISSPQIVQSILQARSLDSLIYSTLLIELSRPHLPSDQVAENQAQLSTYLHSQIFLSYQLNDLVDCVVFAKDDIEANSLTPLSFIQKSTHDLPEIKALISGTKESLIEQLSTPQAFPELQKILMSYVRALTSVLG